MIDWESGYLGKWLANRNPSTVKLYKIAMRFYLEFTGMTPEELIQEKLEDNEKPILEQGVPEDRVKAFYKFLRKDYVSKRTKKKGMAPRSAYTYTSAVADFYSSFKLQLDLDWAKEFPSSTLGKNETEKMTAEQVDTLVSYAPTVRDKTILWIMFQSGIDVSQVCSLTWGQVEKDMDNSQVIDGYRTVMLRGLSRKKELNTKFNTLFGETAIKYLKLNMEKTYGEDWKAKMEYNTPLFLGRSGKRHSARYVQAMMREIAPDSGLAGSRQKEADLNPLSPRSLRASFADQMAKAGASSILVDYLQGHKMKYGTAYFGGEHGLRETYVRYAKNVLEPKRIKDSGEMVKDISDLQKRVITLMDKVEAMEGQMDGLMKTLGKFFEFIKEDIKDQDNFLKGVQEVIKDFKEVRF